MNLNSSLQSMLDTPTKAFEVALRCFVADNLLCQYPDEQSLKDEIQKRIDAIKGTHIILSGKIASSNILSAKEWPSFWSNTLFSRNCFLNKEHTISHDVVFLSESFNRFLIISLDVLICRYSPLLRAFPALFISEEPHKSFYYPSCFHSQK